MLPPLLPSLTAIVPRHKGFSWRGHARNLTRDFTLAATQIVFNIAFLARIAYLALDAILRTMFRLVISKRYLLEWVTFAQSAYSRNSTGKGLRLQLTGSLLFTTAVIATIAIAARANLVIASPFLVLWAFSPLIARWASESAAGGAAPGYFAGGHLGVASGGAPDLVVF